MIIVFAVKRITIKAMHIHNEWDHYINHCKFGLTGQRGFYLIYNYIK